MRGRDEAPTSPGRCHPQRGCGFSAQGTQLGRQGPGTARAAPRACKGREGLWSCRHAPSWQPQGPVPSLAESQLAPGSPWGAGLTAPATPRWLGQPTGVTARGGHRPPASRQPRPGSRPPQSSLLWKPAARPASSVGPMALQAPPSQHRSSASTCPLNGWGTGCPGGPWRDGGRSQCQGSRPVAGGRRGARCGQDEQDGVSCEHTEAAAGTARDHMTGQLVLDSQERLPGAQGLGSLSGEGTLPSTPLSTRSSRLMTRGGAGPGSPFCALSFCSCSRHLS